VLKAIATAVENAWYKQLRWIWLLWPLMVLFAGVSGLRRWLFRAGIKTSQKPNVPVVVVGNISVGGTGKTPLVIALCQALIDVGFKPGVVSRGYGGTLPEQQTYPVLVTRESVAEQVGDEPALMKQNLDCAVMIDPIRKRAAAALVEQHHCNVIVCDDGLQHYALGRDVEIVVVDGERRFGNRQLLPVGPLREGLWRLKQVDFIVRNQSDSARSALDEKSSDDKSSDHESLVDVDEHKSVENVGVANSLGLAEQAMTLQANTAINLLDPTLSRPLTSFNEPVLAMAGIGNPQRFFTMLQSKGIALARCDALSDHHAFSAADIPSEAQGSVLMTEKDAVKCRNIAHGDCWYVPVTAELSATFLQQFTDKISTINEATHTS